MSIGGVVALFRGAPRDPVGEGGRMSLGDHFRELRARLMRSVLYLVLGTVVALFFYSTLFNLLLTPYNDAREMLGQSTQTQAVITGVGTPLMLQLKICGSSSMDHLRSTRPSVDLPAHLQPMPTSVSLCGFRPAHTAVRVSTTGPRRCAAAIR